MRLKPDQLGAALTKGLAPIYFFSSDEPLQLLEMADAVRATAKSAGFSNREILSVDASFHWQELTAAGNALSIFADSKIIDLRMNSALPGNEGAKALCQYCDKPAPDTVLLITSGQLKKEALKSRWFQALDKAGVVIQAWPLEDRDLQQWLQQRLQQRGLIAEPSGIKILAARIEGNLLAAAQEIEKLYVLYGSGRLSNQQINDAVADSSRYDVFKLIDCVLAANVKRIFKVLSGLQADDIAPLVVLWAITREARTLIKIQLALAQGQNRDTVFRNQQIWDKRKQLVNNVLTRLNIDDLQHILTLSAKADRQCKGQQAGDAWQSLLEICLQFAAVKPLV